MAKNSKSNQRKVSSGCSTGMYTPKDGKGDKAFRYVRGWRSLGGGMAVNYFACATKNTTQGVAKQSNRRFETWMLSIASPLGYSQVSCFYYPDTKQVFCPECNICLSVDKDYAGPYIKSNKK